MGRGNPQVSERSHIGWQRRVAYTAERAGGWAPYWIVSAAIVALMFFIGGFIFAIPAVIGGFAAEPGGTIGARTLIGMLLIYFPAIAILSLMWIRLIEKRTFRSIGLHFDDWRKRAKRGWWIGVLMAVGLYGGVTYLGGYEVGAVAPILAAPREIIMVIFFAVLFLVQGSIEEVLFRGWLLTAVTEQKGLLAGVLISSTVFGLMHFSGGAPLAVINPFLIGVFLCLWTLRTGSLIGACAWHGGWNWMVLTGFGIPLADGQAVTPALLFHLVPAGPLWLSGGAEGNEPTIVHTIFLVAACLVVYRWHKAKTPWGESVAAN